MILASVGLLGRPQKTAVWIRPGVNSSELAFDFGRVRGKSREVTIDVVRVYHCSDIVGVGGTEADRRAMWALWSEGRARTLSRVRYGEVPPGFRSSVGPKPLVPGCYIVQISGTGRTSFVIEPNHEVTDEGPPKDRLDSTAAVGLVRAALTKDSALHLVSPQISAMGRLFEAYVLVFFEKQEEVATRSRQGIVGTVLPWGDVDLKPITSIPNHNGLTLDSTTAAQIAINTVRRSDGGASFAEYQVVLYLRVPPIQILTLVPVPHEGATITDAVRTVVVRDDRSSEILSSRDE